MDRNEAADAMEEQHAPGCGDCGTRTALRGFQRNGNDTGWLVQWECPECDPQRIKITSGILEGFEIQPTEPEDPGQMTLAQAMTDGGSSSTGGYPAMTLTEAVRAVNEAGFTLNLDREHREPGKAGWFHAGDGMYEVVNTVDGLDGYVVHGTAGVVAPGELTSTEGVKEALAGREPKPEREYVDLERYLPPGGDVP